MTVDRESPPGAWEREWDARAHTPLEYRREVAELRARIRVYLAEIEHLQRELHELRTHNDAWQREP